MEARQTFFAGVLMIRIDRGRRKLARRVTASTRGVLRALPSDAACVLFDGNGRRYAPLSLHICDLATSAAVHAGHWEAQGKSAIVCVDGHRRTDAQEGRLGECSFRDSVPVVAGLNWQHAAVHRCRHDLDNRDAADARGRQRVALIDRRVPQWPIACQRGLPWSPVRPDRWDKVRRPGCIAALLPNDEAEPLRRSQPSKIDS